MQALVAGCSFNAAEASAIGDVKSILHLGMKLKGIDCPTGKHQALLQRPNEKYPGRTIGSALAKSLDSVFPVFLYFKEYYKLPGMASINDLIAREQNDNLTFDHQLFQALLALVNTDAQTIANGGTSEQLITKLEGVSDVVVRAQYRG